MAIEDIARAYDKDDDWGVTLGINRALKLIEEFFKLIDPTNPIQNLRSKAINNRSKEECIVLLLHMRGKLKYKILTKDDIKIIIVHILLNLYSLEKAYE